MRVRQFALRKAAEDNFIGPADKIARNILRQLGNLHTGRQNALATIGRYEAAHHPHERGLSRPVAAQEAYPLRRLNLARHIVQQRWSEESNRDFVEAD